MGIEQQAFLACCFRNLTEQPVVNFDDVAKELGMSKGGAQNKYRALMKELQGATTAATKKGTAKPKAKSPAKPAAKRKPLAQKAKRPETDSSDSNDSDEDVPAKKAKLSDHAEAGTKAKKGGKGGQTGAAKNTEANASEDESDDEMHTTSSEMEESDGDSPTEEEAI